MGFASSVWIFRGSDCRVEKALDWCVAGLDFADALHAAFSGAAEKFATFDDKLVRRAKKIPGLSVQAV
jgi:predicted nucleic acid-binding protein